MTIEQMKSFVVEAEKYLKGLLVWQVNEGNQGALQTQTETRAFWVMVGGLKGVLADTVEADHLSATTASSLDAWPMSARTPQCHIVVGNHSHLPQPKCSMCMCQLLCQQSIRPQHLWCHSQCCQDICCHSVRLVVCQGYPC